MLPGFRQGIIGSKAPLVFPQSTVTIGGPFTRTQNGSTWYGYINSGSGASTLIFGGASGGSIDTSMIDGRTTDAVLWCTTNGFEWAAFFSVNFTNPGIVTCDKSTTGFGSMSNLGSPTWGTEQGVQRAYITGPSWSFPTSGSGYFQFKP